MTSDVQCTPPHLATIGPEHSYITWTHFHQWNIQQPEINIETKYYDYYIQYISTILNLFLNVHGFIFSIGFLNISFKIKYWARMMFYEMHSTTVPTIILVRFTNEPWVFSPRKHVSDTWITINLNEMLLQERYKCFKYNVVDIENKTGTYT